MLWNRLEQESQSSVVDELCGSNLSDCDEGLLNGTKKVVGSLWVHPWCQKV